MLEIAGAVLATCGFILVAAAAVSLLLWQWKAVGVFGVSGLVTTVLGVHAIRLSHRVIAAGAQAGTRDVADVFE